MTLKKKSKINAEFNMSSMTDLIFLLLIFFVLTSAVTSNESVLKVILPKGVSTDKVVSKITHVYVTEDLRYAVEKQIVPFDQLPDAIAKAITRNSSPNQKATISVGADKHIEYDKVMEMVKLCDQLGAKVVLALEKDGSVPSARK